MAAFALANGDTLCVTAAHRNHLLRHERIVEYHVGLHHDAMGAKGQQIFGTGTGADERHVTRRTRTLCQQSIGCFACPVLVACLDLLCRLAGEEGLPESPAHSTPRQCLVDAIAIGLGQPCERSERGREQRVDLRSDHLGENGTSTLRADGDRHGCAIDERRGIEIAIVGLVDGIGRNVARAGCEYDGAVERVVARRGEDERRALELFKFKGARIVNNRQFIHQCNEFM